MTCYDTRFGVFFAIALKLVFQTNFPTFNTFRPNRLIVRSPKLIKHRDVPTDHLQIFNVRCQIDARKCTFFNYSRSYGGF